MASGFALLSVGDVTVGERAPPLICLKGGVQQG